VHSEEGFGYPVVEAMAAGTPAITSSIDVLQEVAEGAAWTVPPGRVEPLARQMIIFDGGTTEISERVTRGRSRVRHFTTARAADEMIQVYEELRRARGTHSG
jgi:glycosyltransferase involved in cell wall biosynthesis